VLADGFDGIKEKTAISKRGSVVLPLLLVVCVFRSRRRGRVFIY
jgi:hypothetical protein